MHRRDGWRRAAVAAVVTLAAVAGVAIVRRDLPQPEPRPRPAPVSTRAPAPGTTTTPDDRPALLERTGPGRSPRWTVRDAADPWTGPPDTHGPATVGGLVVAARADPAPGRVGAYDAGTGQLRWRYRAGGAASLWAASRSAVVVGSDPGRLDGLEPGTGRRRWRVRLAPGQGPDAATLSGDRLLVGTSFPGEGDLRPPVVYALDGRTGRRRWRARLRRGTDLQWAPPVVAEGLVLVASTPSHPGSAPGHLLHALDAATGRARWELALSAGDPGFHAERPLLHRGLLLVPSPGALLAVDPGSGRELWRRPVEGLPQVVGTSGALVVALVEDEVVGVSARDGVERWRLDLAARHRWAAMGGGRLYALTGGLIMAVDPATGAVRWRSVTGPAVGPPLPAGERIYVPTSGGLVALAAGSGVVAWVGAERTVTGSPLAAGGRVLVTTRTGDLLGYAP